MAQAIVRSDGERYGNFHFNTHPSIARKGGKSMNSRGPKANFRPSVLKWEVELTANVFRALRNHFNVREKVRVANQVGCPGWDRTSDQVINSHLLYH